MDKYPGKSKPNGFTFSPLAFGIKASHSADDELPPGQIPQQMNLGHFQAMSLSPYGTPFKTPMAFDQNNDMMNFGQISYEGNQAGMARSAATSSMPSMSNMTFSSNLSSSSRLTTPERFIRTVSQENVGKLKINSNHEPLDFVASDLKDLGEIGRGAFGSVNRMVHFCSQTEMAVKRIRSTVDEKEQNRLLMDLDVVMRSSDCQYIVKFYGALFWEGDCWICMELMSTSLDKFYRFVYGKKKSRIPEEILGKIAEATVKALHYLKEELQIMHRDVKPSNILIDKRGNIKLCDFGISGHLVNSIAKTRDAGCRPYMAPERIDTTRSRNGYDVRSDVWSLGITLIELATGKFPYPKWNNVFDQLTQVVKGDPPKLQTTMNELTFTPNFVEFINMLTIADPDVRPKYDQLLATTYLQYMAQRNVGVANYFTAVLNTMTDADFIGQIEDGFQF